MSRENQNSRRGSRTNNVLILSSQETVPYAFVIGMLLLNLTEDGTVSFRADITDNISAHGINTEALAMRLIFIKRFPWQDKLSFVTQSSQ